MVTVSIVVFANYFYKIGSYLCEYLKQIQKDIETQKLENFNLENFRKVIKKHVEIYIFFDRVTALFAHMFICFLGFQMREVIFWTF